MAFSFLAYGTRVERGNRYTAVGRKEIITFFYLYAIVQLLAIFLDSGIIPTSSPAYLVSASL